MPLQWRLRVGLSSSFGDQPDSWIIRAGALFLSTHKADSLLRDIWDPKDDFLGIVQCRMAACRLDAACLYTSKETADGQSSEPAVLCCLALRTFSSVAESLAVVSETREETDHRSSRCGFASIFDAHIPELEMTLLSTPFC